ncbi:hypothetical protein B296_00021039 [Ensete ventricosum]|uniref:Gnk2-homologous domain-containing protein n=1 Tax=Ensete ventricosum TaxID=4639 RepID=A0A426ZXG1_ENSVE|nr:hypothetical protein B296_00021039 [Ensete ventricosum]
MSSSSSPLFSCSAVTEPAQPCSGATALMMPTTPTNSTFQTNLQLLLASLPSSAAAATGYSNSTEGLSSDQVHGLALCRGDVSSTVCQT